MRKFLLVVSLVIVSVALSFNVNAQKATKQYQRPSLHMVLITSEEPSCDDPELLPYVDTAWNSYQIPSLYNNFEVPFKSTQAGKPKGSMMELLRQYGDPNAFANMSTEELKNLLTLLDGKGYLEELKAFTDANSEEIAHQLLARWWGIQEDGSWSFDTISKYACYGATQDDIAKLRESAEGLQALAGALTDVTIKTTFVAFSKIDFCNNEPLAKLTYNIMMAIAAQLGSPANIPAELAAKKVYEKMAAGYSAYSNTLLYQLEWNDSIANIFYSCWTSDGKIDMEKFNSTPFKLEYLGCDKSTAMTMGKKDLGPTQLVVKTIKKNINKQIVKMQNSYEDFKPMVPIVDINTAQKYMVADMGTKESITPKDKFDVLDAVVDINGVTKYKKIGVVKIGKAPKGDTLPVIWDNEEIENQDLQEGVVYGTKLTLLKNATPSMFVKKQKAKK